MIRKSIANPDLLMGFDEISKTSYYGCNQLWFKTKWQRLSGCGPSVASTLFFYLTYTTAGIKSDNLTSKENWLLLMEEMWKYVTPSIRGVHKTNMFYEPMLTYTKSIGLNLKSHVFEVPKDKSLRPKLQDLVNFILEALSNDLPVAFLNLCNGDVKNLDKWHWVTVISLEYDKNEQSAFITAIDGGLLWKIDLNLWYETTTKGGGFVYFSPGN